MEYILLNDGNRIPALGFGTYKIDSDDEAERCVNEALEAGYDLIDTATFYENEKGVGRALSSSGLKRNKYFVTTKIWPTVQKKDDVKRNLDNSLEWLRSDYIDMVLIHWPHEADATVFETMNEYKEKGLIKSIGVSNYKEHHIDSLIKKTGLIPCLDQVELHPYFQQKELRSYLKEKNIACQAWAPLMRAKLFDDEVLVKLSSKYNKTPAQIILRYDLQAGILTIPKSTHQERIKENFDIFDFSLETGDMELIKSMDKNIRQFRDPDNHGFC
ncbi:MAG: aldo/keto reductase [Clostridia bacterium]|nr:aldo/keto reductase [Clostridia bacterium]